MEVAPEQVPSIVFSELLRFEAFHNTVETLSALGAPKSNLPISVFAGASPRCRLLQG